jgi:hypothetical protein
MTKATEETAAVPYDRKDIKGVFEGFQVLG